MFFIARETKKIQDLKESKSRPGAIKAIEDDSYTLNTASAFSVNDDHSRELMIQERRESVAKTHVAAVLQDD